MRSLDSFLLILVILLTTSVSAQQNSEASKSDDHANLVKRMAMISKALDLPNAGGIPILGSEFFQLTNMPRKQKDDILHRKATFHNRIALGYCEALTQIDVPMDDYYLVDSSQRTTALAIYHNLLGDEACQPYVERFGKSIWLGKSTEERMRSRQLFLEKYGERLKRLAIKPPFLFASYVRVKIDTLKYDSQREAFPIAPLATDGFSGSRKFELRVSGPMSFFTDRKGLTSKAVTYTKPIEWDFPRWWNISSADREKAIRMIDEASIRTNGTKLKPRTKGQYYIHALVDIKVTPEQAKPALENMPRGMNFETFPIGGNFHASGTVTRLRFYLKPDFKVRLSDYDIN